MGLDSHLQAQFAPGTAQSNVSINKSGKRLNPVQEGLNFEVDSWPFGRGFVVDFKLTNYFEP
jgi:hypothetical protein